MSIQEALERGPLDRERELVFLGDVGKETEEFYRAQALQEGVRILEEAKVPQLLHELANIIKTEYPDVKVNDPKLSGDFTVEMNIEWNYREEKVARGKEPMCDTVFVLALPTSRGLTIATRQAELLKYEQWSTKPQVLEDAIVRAYRNPVPCDLSEKMV